MAPTRPKISFPTWSGPKPIFNIPNDDKSDLWILLKFFYYFKPFEIFGRVCDQSGFRIDFEF